MTKIPERIWFDVKDDWDLIESSFAKQYGIRLRENSGMPFSEFQQLLSGLMSDTPLGNAVSIRSEDDKDVIKNFTPSMVKDRSEWRSKQAKKKVQNEIQLEKEMVDLENTFKKMFG